MRSTHRFSRRLAPIVLFGLSLFLLAGCAGNSDPAADQTTTEPAVEAPAGGEENRASVDIANSAFSPAELRIKAGTTVVWTNGDAVDHQVHDDSNAFKSDILGQGGAVEVNYSAPGTFNYHCHVHSNMKATVIVE